MSPGLIPLLAEILRYFKDRREEKKAKQKARDEAAKPVPVPPPLAAINPPFTRDDLLMGRAKWEDLPVEHRNNIDVLLDRLNRLIALLPFRVRLNDAYRRLIDQPKHAAEHSRHLTGEAVDLDDDDTLYLWKWILENLEVVAKLGFWMEDPRWSHGAAGTWMHLQTSPPGSGRRIYVPSVAPASAPDIWDGKYDAKFNQVFKEAA